MSDERPCSTPCKLCGTPEPPDDGPAMLVGAVLGVLLVALLAWLVRP